MSTTYPDYMGFAKRPSSSAHTADGWERAIAAGAKAPVASSIGCGQKACGGPSTPQDSSDETDRHQDWWNPFTWNGDTWQNVGAVAAGVAVALIVTAAVVSFAACTVVTLGVCGVAGGAVIAALVVGGAAGGLTTYHLSTGNKTPEGYIGAGLTGGAGGFIGGAAGPALAPLVSKVPLFTGASSTVNAVAATGLTTAKDQAVFWTGVKSGPETAAEWASRNGGMSLEMTLEQRAINVPTYSQADPASIEAWRTVSTQFAEGASGTVRVLQGDAVRLQSIWATREYQALINNPKVDRIISIDSKTGREDILWTR